MALTFTNTIDGGLRTFNLTGGLRVVNVEMTVGATGDYSSGFTITADNLGLHVIFTIVGVHIRQSDGTIRPLLGLYDHDTGKLRLYLQLDPADAGGANIPFTEITAATHLAASDVVNFVALGV